jgi:Holliday junction resolvase RusA-like endonuclease
MRIDFSLPLPPSVNHCYGRARWGVYLKKDAKLWKKSAVEIISAAMTGHRKIPGKVIVEITIFWENRRRRDSDNLLKLTLDSMGGVVFKDDHVALPRIMDFSVDQERPRIEVSARKA